MYGMVINIGELIFTPIFHISRASLEPVPNLKPVIFGQLQKLLSLIKMFYLTKKIVSCLILKSI